LLARGNGHKCPLRDTKGISREKRNLEEAVLHGEACSCGTGAYPKLMVDGVEVPLDGAGAKEEPFGDLGVGEAFGH
jgi:hypothetical protein